MSKYLTYGLNNMASKIMYSIHYDILPYLEFSNSICSFLLCVISPYAMFNSGIVSEDKRKTSKESSKFSIFKG